MLQKICVLKKSVLSFAPLAAQTMHIFQRIVFVDICIVIIIYTGSRSIHVETE